MPERAAGSQREPAAWAAVVSNLSDYGFIWPVVVALQLLAGRRGRVDALVRLGLVGLGSLLVTRLLKLNGPDRPATDRSASTWVRTPSSPRFPSGHTLASAAAAVAIPEGAVGQAAALAFTASVAASRLELGAHEPVDVVAGAVAGLGVGAVVRWALRP